MRLPSADQLVKAFRCLKGPGTCRSILPPEIQSFTCTSINLNCNYAVSWRGQTKTIRGEAKRHRDARRWTVWLQGMA